MPLTDLQSYGTPTRFLPLEWVDLVQLRRWDPLSHWCVSVLFHQQRLLVLFKLICELLQLRQVVDQLINVKLLFTF